MTSYRHKLNKIVSIKKLKLILYEFQNTDNYESLNSQHYKMLYLFLTNLKYRYITKLLIKCIIYITYSLIGDHVNYYYDTPNKTFNKKCITIINEYNPILIMYRKN